MSLSRAQALWRYLAPQAEDTSVRPQIDAIDLALKARIQDVKADLDTARTHILAIEAALPGKASVNHTHPIADIAQLANALTSLQTRVSALEAKVP